MVVTQFLTADSGGSGSASWAHLSWSGVDEMEAVIRSLAMPLQLLQLDGGHLGGGVVAIRIGPLRLLRFRMDRCIHSWGPKPLGELTISLDLEPSRVRPPMRTHGSCLPESCLFGVDSGREVHLTLPKEVVLGLVVIPHDTLVNWADQLGCGGFDLQQACRRNVLPVDPLRCEGLRAYLRQIFALVASDPGRLEQLSSQRLILEDLLPLLLEALIHGADQAGRLLRPPARIEIVKAAQQWLHDHPQQPITLTDLCQQAHASRRSLIQGFHDHLGMGPMAYVKLQRLHSVRRLLLRADSDQVRIGSIAAEWGFLNAGHFARDYRLLFGELPRDTLSHRITPG
ncbi:MAG: helix-turn-helix domain-containing protein [Cyanobacteria bacterium]|nr:helix-turn-helix domain-containing protein [Cyanobacteriota bacterium]